VPCSRLLSVHCAPGRTECPHTPHPPSPLVPRCPLGRRSRACRTSQTMMRLSPHSIRSLSAGACGSGPQANTTADWPGAKMTSSAYGSRHRGTGRETRSRHGRKPRLHLRWRRLSWPARRR
jgi:hypothetical protein